MKKLNRKGFTLIELLAVVVILAIIVVVSVPLVMDSIQGSRYSTLKSYATEMANWYASSYAQDSVNINGVATEELILKGYKLSDSNWHCLSEKIPTSGHSFAELYKASGDLQISGTNLKVPDFTFNGDGQIITANTDLTKYCSAIRLVNSKAEVFLIAKDGGQFDTNGSTLTYAISYGKVGYDSIAK